MTKRNKTEQERRRQLGLDVMGVLCDLRRSGKEFLVAVDGLHKRLSALDMNPAGAKEMVEDLHRRLEEMQSVVSEQCGRALGDVVQGLVVAGDEQVPPGFRFENNGDDSLLAEVRAERKASERGRRR
jgi:hypothetical protein